MYVSSSFSIPGLIGSLLGGFVVVFCPSTQSSHFMDLEGFALVI